MTKRKAGFALQALICRDAGYTIWDQADLTTTRNLAEECFARASAGIVLQFKIANTFGAIHINVTFFTPTDIAWNTRVIY